MSEKKSARVAKLGLLLAVTLILALVENMLPPVIPVLPYAKVGFSNLAILAVLLLFGVREGYLILSLKCLLVAVFSGNYVALLWSVPAGFISFSVMVALRYCKIFSITGISAAGGITHNFVQIVVASIVVGKSVFFYLPYMILAGSVAGVFIWICCHLLIVSIQKTSIKI